MPARKAQQKHPRAATVTDGLVVVDKPSGMTSHDVVARCRRIFAQRKVGHAGTLDPDATGILVVALGRATRLMRYMSGLEKSYTTEIVLGEATSTLDSSGELTATWDMSAVSLDDAVHAATLLTGPILQVPPMVSAIKVGGRRLYELARQGVEVERAPRPVNVERFDVSVAGAGQHGPVLQAQITCSSGTYVRSLAEDLGRRLGGGAHVRNLRRQSVGPWHLTDSATLDTVGDASVIPLVDCLPWLEAVAVSGDVERKVSYGRNLTAQELSARRPGPWRLVSARGSLLAVYASDGSGGARAEVVIEAAG